MLDIVIVNWNTGKLLRECITALDTAADGLHGGLRIIVVDNASVDGSLSSIGEGARVPILVVKNAENVGFAAACNKGAREGKAEFLLFLNPDTRVTSECLTVPMELLRRSENSAIGVCGVRLLSEKGSPVGSCSRFPRVYHFFSECFALDKLIESKCTQRFLSAKALANDQVVDQVSGAFFFIRRSVFERLGGFDERFFVYYEDVDLARRVKASGFNSFYLSQCWAIHVGGASSSKVLGRRLFYGLRSRLLYADKHLRRSERLALRFVTYVIEPVCRLTDAILRLSCRRLFGLAEGYYLLVRWALGPKLPR